MKRNRFSLRRTALIFVVAVVVAAFAAVVAAFVYPFCWPSRAAWQYASILSNALKNARSITLVEFQRDIFGPELVFSRIPASPQQITEFRAATGACLIWGTMKAMCFDPHHRVEIVRADGSTLRFEICFRCENFTLGDQFYPKLPPCWREDLA